MAVNGANGGLVSITAEPLMPSMFGAVWIGAIGGVLVVLTIPLLDKFKIDDVVGAIPAHLVCGIWGTMDVPVYGDASFLGQFVGVALTGIFVSAASIIVWYALKLTIGVRVSEEEEQLGLDRSDTGVGAYPEFAS